MAEIDPLDGDARLVEYFASAWPVVERFHGLLASEGEVRGLIGPRELGRLWERHLLNSAAVVPFVASARTIADVGSGAGLPGVVVAAMRRDAEVTLVEPMERRAAWLSYVVEELALENVTVARARAEEVHGELIVDAVVARAVAPLDRLYRWTAPLLKPNGVLVALKGARAEQEISESAAVARKFRLQPATAHEAPTIDGLDATRVVVARRVA